MSGHLYREDRGFSPEQCAEIVRTIDSLRPHWENRREGLPFYTLGTASYLDAAAPAEENRQATSSSTSYSNKAAASNDLLRHHFHASLEILRTTLSRLLGQPIEDLPGAAKPGFHIFEAHPAFAHPMASVHFDFQYQRVPWPVDFDPKTAFSFTLPLALPSAGGGLRYWKLTPGSLAGLSISRQKTLIDETPPEFLPYDLGTLVVHGGHLLHQIAPAPNMAPHDRRITWQGHGGVAGGRIYWYW